MRRILTTAALSLTAALGTITLANAPAKAWGDCNSFNYGIGRCVNEGYFRSSSSSYSPSLSRSYSVQRPMLLEQPRFQPSFGSGYYGGSSRWGW